ncbi:MAG: dihydroneopterin aldolase [Burkholderiales bacterium]|nr:dihydroneopterin aldolase [Burkholderiales bacterium]
MDTQSIFIRGLRIDAQIGVHAHEKNRTQPLKLDAELQIADTRFHPSRDKLDEVFDYQTIRAAMIEVVRDGHINLLETLADRVVERLLAMAEVRAVRVRVHKYTAFDDVEEVGVEIHRRKPE